MLAIAIQPEQVDLDAVSLARSISKADMDRYLTFCEEHEAQGHTMGDFAIAAFAPLPES